MLMPQSFLSPLLILPPSSTSCLCPGGTGSAADFAADGADLRPAQPLCKGRGQPLEPAVWAQGGATCTWTTSYRSKQPCWKGFWEEVALGQDLQG